MYFLFPNYISDFTLDNVDEVIHCAVVVDQNVSVVNFVL